jgi:hypothetical protein
LGPHRSHTLPFEPFRFWLRIRGDIRNRKTTGERAGGIFLLSPTCDTVPLKQDKPQQEMSQWKNHYVIWTAGLPIIYPTLLVLFFFCQNHFPSFSSLQDDRISTL